MIVSVAAEPAVSENRMTSPTATSAPRMLYAAATHSPGFSGMRPETSLIRLSVPSPPPSGRAATRATLLPASSRTIRSAE
jgi:hypothetical protein